MAELTTEQVDYLEWLDPELVGSLKLSLLAEYPDAVEWEASEQASAKAAYMNQLIRRYNDFLVSTDPITPEPSKDWEGWDK